MRSNFSLINKLHIRIISISLIAGMLFSAKLAEADPFVYVANYGSNTISVIDASNDTVVTTITLPEGSSTYNLAITPNGQKAYFTSNSFPGLVLVIDTKNNTLDGTPIVVGDGPEGIAITPDGKFAYVANFFGAISVIDTKSNTVVDTIGVGSEPTWVAISPDGKHVYAATGGDGIMYVIETTTNKVVRLIGVGWLPEGIAITPDGKKVYVTNFNSHNVSVINTMTYLVTTIPVGFFPLGIAITPNGKRVYVADNDRITNNGSIAVIDTTNDTIITRVTLPPGSAPRRLAITPDGMRAYVTRNFPSQVLAIDLVSNIVVGEPIMVGDCPEGIAITPILPKKIPILIPNGGDVIPSGGIYAICWQAPLEAVKFGLFYSINNGTTWNLIKTVTGLNCTHWEEVPVVTANKKKCRVKVIGYDSNGTPAGEGISDKPFTIEVLRVTSPNGGETLKSGNTSTIQWTTYKTIRPVAKTVLKYTTDGSSWNAIKTLSGNPGSFNWKVPAVSSTKYKVKVILKDAGGVNIGTDVSDKFFTIQP